MSATATSTGEAPPRPAERTRYNTGNKQCEHHMPKANRRCSRSTSQVTIIDGQARFLCSAHKPENLAANRECSRKCMQKRYNEQKYAKKPWLAPVPPTTIST